MVRGGVYSHSEKAQNLASMDAAANSYLASLKAVDKTAGTVYVVRKSDGQVLPNFIYASEQSLYGSYKAVSFVPPSRDVAYVPDNILLPVVLFPIGVVVAGTITVANAIDAGRGDNAPTVQSAEKPGKPPQNASSVWSASKAILDPRLDGQWRTIDEITRYSKDGTHFVVRGTVCVLDIVKDRMSYDCSTELGSISHQASKYRLLEAGKYEFQIIKTTD